MTTGVTHESTMTIEDSQKNWIDRAWMAFILIAGGAASACIAKSLFDATVSISGVLCVGLIAIGRREGYLFGLYNSVAYSVLAYANGLFGEVYLNLLFFVPTGVIGYFMWSRHLGQGKTVRMTQIGWLMRFIVAIVCIVSTVGLGYILRLNPHQNTPFIDASTNVLSVVATVLMMWRYKEQWLLYILVNIVTIIMWVQRFRAGGAAGDLMIVMWSLFLLNSLFGCWRWHVGTVAERITSSGMNAGDETCDVV